MVRRPNIILTLQRAKLGGADASKMHPLFQALCLIICSRILPYLNKTADSDAAFSKVSPLAIFAGNKIGEKYHVTFSGKEARWTIGWTRGGAEGPKEVAQNKEHANLLRWHKEDRKKDVMLRHPADGSQWIKLTESF